MLGPNERYTILNVNDSESARYVASKMIRNAGFQVLEASGGAQALALLRERRPDLVILDVRLPDMDGYEICTRIRDDGETAGIGVLLTSATFTTSERKVQGLEVGADGYLVQPFEPAELIAVIKSILRFKRAEQELRSRNGELAATDRRKDEFLAMLAHELRNPLAAMSASLPLLERHPARDRLEERARGVLRRQATHLTRLVDDLLDVARVTQGRVHLERTTVDLAPLLREAAESARELWTRSRGQPLELELPAGPIPVEGDPARLEQIFGNLLENASKYSEPSQEIRVDVLREGQEVCVRIRDQGLGISPEILPHVFDLFAQGVVPLARSQGGLGIGLTLTRRLVELHGGTILARSDGPGRGSCFEVRLPLRDDTLERSDKRRLLVVEDNEDLRQSLCDLCIDWGYEVHEAPDGEKGLELALRLQPDLMLVDIGLPGLDGYELASRVRASEATDAIRLVALTGYGSPEHRRRSAEAGFDRHLVKPVDSSTFASVIAEVLS